MLDLYDGSGNLMATNDSWTSEQSNILGTLLPPDSKREAAILMTLAPGSYTAVVRDRNGQPGLALIEVYDLDPKDSLLANISTPGEHPIRGQRHDRWFHHRWRRPDKSAGPGDWALAFQLWNRSAIGGSDFGVTRWIWANFSSNDDWRTTQEAEIRATGVAPTDSREAAIVATLEPGSYTVIVRGRGDTTGVGLVEIYNLDSTAAVAKGQSSR